MAGIRQSYYKSSEPREPTSQNVSEIQPLIACKGCGSVFVEELLPFGPDKFLTDVHHKPIDSCYCPVCKTILDRVAK